MDNALPELRRTRNLSQGDLAAEVGVTRQTINAIERDRYDPSLPLAFKLATFFDVSIENIFYPEFPDDE